MTRTALTLLLLVACDGGMIDAPVTCGPGTIADETTCVRDTASCGAGTHEVAGACAPDAIAGVQVRAASRMIADGLASYEVRVFATNDDGTPRIGDTFVLNVDRPGAGTFATAQVVLDERGASTSFAPCDGTVPGCVGPVRLTVAHVATPTSPVASTTIELASPPGVGSMDRCPPGENTLHITSNGYLYRGDLSIFGGGWVADGGNRSARLTIGTHWSVDTSTVPLGTDMTVGVFSATAAENEAHLIVRGPGTQPDCGTTGAFEVHEFEYSNGELKRLSLTFRERCLQAVPTELSGCLRYVRGL